MPLRARAILLPFALLIVGGWLLQGCLYIPTFNAPLSEDPSKQVGGEHSRKPLRVNGATRDDVERVLGMPERVNVDGTEIVYGWEARKGIWVYPLFFQTETDDQRRALLLRFDEHGMLRSYDVGRYGELLRSHRWNYGGRLRQSPSPPPGAPYRTIPPT